MREPLKKEQQYEGDDSVLDPIKVEMALSDLTFKLLAYHDEGSAIWLGVQVLATVFTYASRAALFNASRRHYHEMIERKREEERQRMLADQQREADANSSAASASALPEVPDGFLCPISHSVLVDPVIAQDGHTYERDAIEQWLTTHITSPLTGAEMGSTTLTPNFALRDVINQMKHSANFMLRGKIDSMTTKTLFHILYRGTRYDYISETAAQAINSFLDSHVRWKKNCVRYGRYVEEDRDPVEVESARSKFAFKADERMCALIYAIDEPIGK